MSATLPAVIDVDEALLREWPLRQPGASADKEDRGTTLVIAGSREMPGAAWLAALAALRAGAGKLTVATAASVAAGLALALPEARVVALPETDDGGFAIAAAGLLGPLLACSDAVLIGPGMQDEPATRRIVTALVASAGGVAVILDALAMNVAADGWRFAATPLLTPHAGEMAQLTGLSKDAICADPERHAREAAVRLNAIVALKGACTFVAAPDGRCWRHQGDNPGLGTSGSGDTLAGIITGLAARGAELTQAAVWGVALHAAAGRVLAQRQGPIGYLASELAAEIPRLMHRLAQADR